MKKNITTIGSIRVNGSVTFTDPGRSPGDRTYHELEDFLPGLYTCSMWTEMLSGVETVLEVTVRHSSRKRTPMHERAPFLVGIDSGQACISDASCYRRAHGTEQKAERFFWRAARRLDRRTTGIIGSSAVVCRSGLGDGTYEVYLSRNATGVIVAAQIRFHRPW